MPELAIILLNYGGAKDTEECVRSLEKSAYRDFEITIVDNASRDGSVESLRAACPHSLLIANEKNLGFAEGNNVGIRRALQQGRRFVLLLNNDTVVEPDTLGGLMSALRRHPDAGIVGGKILYYDHPELIWFAGGYFNEHSALGGHCGIGKADAPAFSREGPSPYMTGCCLLARREVFDTVGLLAKEYFAYLEDVEFCIRARRKGFSIVYAPAARIYHKVSRTSAWDSPMYLYLNLRNKILFLRRNTPATEWLPNVPRLAFFYCRQFLRVIFRRMGIVRMRACWFGLVDGLRNFTGEYGEGRLGEIDEHRADAKTPLSAQ
jgi:GT2 family glycosyltransferase